MLDLVPLAGAGRQVVNLDLDADLVGEALEFAFPQANSGAVAARRHPR